jgi:hypothetical protein
MPSVNQEITDAGHKNHRGNSLKCRHWHLPSPHLPYSLTHPITTVPDHHCARLSLVFGAACVASRNFPAFADLKLSDVAGLIENMERVLVRRDQFNISPQGIVHKPTDAAFIPYPGASYAGITRMGQLGNEHPMGVTFSADDVQRIMQELWVEYVQANQGLFNA